MATVGDVEAAKEQVTEFFEQAVAAIEDSVEFLRSVDTSISSASENTCALAADETESILSDLGVPVT